MLGLCPNPAEAVASVGQIKSIRPWQSPGKHKHLVDVGHAILGAGTVMLGSTQWLLGALLIALACVLVKKGRVEQDRRQEYEMTTQEPKESGRPHPQRDSWSGTAPPRDGVTGTAKFFGGSIGSNTLKGLCSSCLGTLETNSQR